MSCCSYPPLPPSGDRHEKKKSKTMKKGQFPSRDQGRTVAAVVVVVAADAAVAVGVVVDAVVGGIAAVGVGRVVGVVAGKVVVGMLVDVPWRKVKSCRDYASPPLLHPHYPHHGPEGGAHWWGWR